MFKFLTKYFDSNLKEINRLTTIVEKINSEESKATALKDGQFIEETAKLKKRLTEGVALDDLLPHSFALVREAARRTIGERHFDVQMMAAVTLHRGAVAEQRTGEGKTVSAIRAV